MNIDVIIPSCLPIQKYNHINQIKNTRTTKGKIIFTGQQTSAAKNRNLGLERVISEYVIMVDDDITGFFNGWDELLVKPLEIDSTILMVSARLLNKDGTIQRTISEDYRIEEDLVIPNKQFIPSAAIAFRKECIKFDETFVGSGFEDTDFCISMRNKFPNTKIIINNKCKLIHLNEMKNQVGHFFQLNTNYFQQKHGFLV